MGAAEGQTYRLSQTLARGLEILVALNQHSGGAATIMQLSKVTGLHRTTVKRLLETLMECGFVRSQPSDNLYRLTFRVQALSAGFRDSSWITDHAAPLMRELGRQVMWPCSILTLEEDEMVVRDSTRSYSPFSLHPGMPGRRLPLLTTSAGKAYLAFCAEEERKILLESLKARGDKNIATDYDENRIIRQLDEVRNRGFAVNIGEWEKEERFGGIAVPIRHNGRTVACLNMAFLVRAVNILQAMDKYLPLMKETARRIEEKFVSSPNPEGMDFS